MEREQGIKLMQDLLRRMVERKGSDLFITAGFPPAIKVDGEIKPQTNQPLSPEQAQLLVRAIMNDRQTKEFDATKECNFAIAPPGIGRFRVSAFVQMGLTGAVLRTINVKVPTIEELELPPILKEIVLSKRGLCILVAPRARASPPRSPRCSTTATTRPAATSSPSRIRSSTCTPTRTAW